MKRKLLLIGLAVLLGMTGCAKKQEVLQETAANENAEELAAETLVAENSEKKTEELPEKTKTEIVTSLDDFKLEPRQYFGTCAVTTVNDDNVNIRAMPNTSAEKIGKLNKGDTVKIKGFSDKRELIDGFNGYWLKIAVDSKREGYYTDNDGYFGWLFSKYVNIDPSTEVSSFNVVKLNPQKDKSRLSFELEIDRNGDIITNTIYSSRLGNQDFYTFVWSDDMPDFKYNDPVGTFKYFPDTNKIEHATYMGSECESAWCLVTDDNKYMMQDYGTSPGVRGLGVYEIATGKSVFEGSYYRDLQYDGESIVCCERISEWNTDISAETKEYAKQFEQATPVPEDYLKLKAQGMDVSTIVLYRFNFETKETEYAGCQYILEQ